MIPYELAVQMKEAGFPQHLDQLITSKDLQDLGVRDSFLVAMREGTGYHRTFDTSILGYPESEPDFFGQGKWRSSSIMSAKYLETEEGKRFTVYFPSLEEVMEACGDIFNYIELYKSGEWSAVASRRQEIPFKIDLRRGKGSTPLEAVCRLWLALNPVDKGGDK